MLTKEEIQKFKKLAKEITGLDLTDSESEDQGGRLITFFDLLIEIDRKNKQKELVKNKKS